MFKERTGKISVKQEIAVIKQDRRGQVKERPGQGMAGEGRNRTEESKAGEGKAGEERAGQERAVVK